VTARKFEMLLLIPLATALLVYGFFAPLFTLTKFFIFDNTVSLFSVLTDLLREGYVSLFVIITLFSVMLPLIKLVFIVFVQVSSARNRRQHKRLVQWLEWIGKWSMLDVFVVAILVVSIKLGSIANVTIHHGVYVFAGAVLLMMVIAHRLPR
jgi:paraquat-inducible protein A